jgi:UDP-N-acetylglucosamine acyltransferase
MASPKDVTIHPTASVHPRAELEAGVWIGPGCVVGEHVRIGRATRLEAHVVIDGWTTIGAENVFSPYSAIGGPPQDIGYDNDETRVVIGDRNLFREFITVHRATTKEERVTAVGDDGYFMAYAHIAHDCRIGNGVILTNGATLGGHVHIGDRANLSAFVGIHQFCKIGRFAFVGGYSVITQDILPFAKVVGQRPPRVFGMNIVGLRRNGFSKERIAAIKQIYDLFFYSGLNTAQALDAIRAQCPGGEDREEILAFIAASKRGLIKKTAETWESGSD